MSEPWNPRPLGYQMASYFFAGLFPILDDAAIAFEMYLYMICGDMLGSFVAFVWTSSVDLSLKADITFVSLVLLSLTSTATALIPSIATISEASQQPHALQRLPSLNDSVATLVFSTFFFGSFSKAGLEAFCPKVMRARLVGVLLGLLGVLLCYLTMLSSLNAPPKLARGLRLWSNASLSQVRLFCSCCSRGAHSKRAPGHCCCGVAASAEPTERPPRAP